MIQAHPICGRTCGPLEIRPSILVPDRGCPVHDVERPRGPVPMKRMVMFFGPYHFHIANVWN